jgi:hypothetical protein
LWLLAQPSLLVLQIYAAKAHAWLTGLLHLPPKTDAQAPPWLATFATLTAAGWLAGWLRALLGMVASPCSISTTSCLLPCLGYHPGRFTHCIVVL